MGSRLREMRNGSKTTAIGQDTNARAISSPPGTSTATIIGEIAWPKKNSTVSDVAADYADEVAGTGGETM